VHGDDGGLARWPPANAGQRAPICDGADLISDPEAQLVSGIARRDWAFPLLRRNDGGLA